MPPFDAVLCDFEGVIRFYDEAEVTELESGFGVEPGMTENVEALALGMTGVLYREVADLRRALPTQLDQPATL